jgi:formate dehydrogenase assembly factor FdhD
MEMEDIVVKEFHLTISLNDRELVTLLCSPEKLDFLAIGFFFRRLNKQQRRHQRNRS